MLDSGSDTLGINYLRHAWDISRLVEVVRRHLVAVANSPNRLANTSTTFANQKTYILKSCLFRHRIHWPLGSAYHTRAAPIAVLLALAPFPSSSKTPGGSRPPTEANILSPVTLFKSV